MKFLDEGFSRTEAAIKANCSARTIDRAIKSGDLAAYQVGKLITVLPSDLSMWIQSKKIKPIVRPGGQRKRIKVSAGRRAA